MKILSLILLLAAAAMLALAGLRTYSIHQYNQKARRRKPGQPGARRRPTRRMDPLTQILYITGAVAVVLAIVAGILAGNADREDTVESQPPSGWQEQGGDRFYLKEDGSRATGWLSKGGERYYLDESGVAVTGWYDLRGSRYYFGVNGTMHTGWLELDGKRYYFREDGTMARGQVEIDGVSCYFDATGAHILLVNHWNPVPEGFEPDLVPISQDYGVEGSQVDSSCRDALIRMIDDCNAEAPRAFVLSSYRTYEYQSNAFRNKVASLVQEGYSQEQAEAEAGTVVAVPGTSEHHLGLAVDVIDTTLWALEEEQADLPAQKWLLENSWRYGFILRYPADKIQSTGIIYEPWHYRYVGEELAATLYTSGLTLEEYMKVVTLASEVIALD